MEDAPDESRKAINIDKTLASIRTATTDERKTMRSNAERWAAGTEAQREAAERLVAALNSQDEEEHNALIDELIGLDAAQRLIRAFTEQPMSDTEAMLIQALLDHPGSTTTTLTQIVGWKEQSWHLHFGTMCRNRAVYLWPAPDAEHRDGKFYSGILCDLKVPENLFTMKPEVAAAFEQLGLQRNPDVQRHNTN
jgi:hypothetical protein